MPGRLCLYDDLAFKKDVRSRLGNFNDAVSVLHQQYNIAPTINIPIYTNEKVYRYAHFGLIPSWAKERSSMQINARCESVFEKSSFKEAYKQRRCLIPLNGYFEWVKDSTTKISQAYFVHSATHTYFVFAGIYESWYDNSLGKSILTCALLTTEPNEHIATIHDRMPVILEKEDWQLWLDDKSSYIDLNTLFTPLASPKTKFFPVSDHVNSVKNEGHECIMEVQVKAVNPGRLF